LEKISMWRQLEPILSLLTKEPPSLYSITSWLKSNQWSCDSNTRCDSNVVHFMLLCHRRHTFEQASLSWSGNFKVIIVSNSGGSWEAIMINSFMQIFSLFFNLTIEIKGHTWHITVSLIYRDKVIFYYINTQHYIMNINELINRNPVYSRQNVIIGQVKIFQLLQ
jgi:hypothetical protein